MGGSASNGHCICCAFRTEYALHVGYNRRGFLNLHACCRAKQINSDEIICHANQITPEAIMPNQSLNLLSGGQTRALMIADIAFICDSPIITN